MYYMRRYLFIAFFFVSPFLYAEFGVNDSAILNNISVQQSRDSLTFSDIYNNTEMLEEYLGTLLSNINQYLVLVTNDYYRTRQISTNLSGLVSYVNDHPWLTSSNLGTVNSRLDNVISNLVGVQSAISVLYGAFDDVANFSEENNYLLTNIKSNLQNVRDDVYSISRKSNDMSASLTDIQASSRSVAGSSLISSSNLVNITSYQPVITNLLSSIADNTASNKVDLSNISVTNLHDYTSYLSQIAEDVRDIYYVETRALLESLYEEYDYQGGGIVSDAKPYLGYLPAIQDNTATLTNFVIAIDNHVHDITNIQRHISSDLHDFYSIFTNSWYYPTASQYTSELRYNNGVYSVNRSAQSRLQKDFIHNLSTHFYDVYKGICSINNYLNRTYELYQPFVTNSLNAISYGLGSLSNATFKVKAEIDEPLEVTLGDTMDYIFDAPNYNRSTFVTPVYFYKGYVGNPVQVQNQVLSPDVSGFSYVFDRFIPNSLASINNYLNDFWSNGIKANGLSVTNQLYLTNIVTVATTNNFDLSFTNSIFAIEGSSTNIESIVNALVNGENSITNLVSTLLSLDMTSPLSHYSPSDDGSLRTYLTNYYYRVSTGDFSAGEYSSTNWFNRIEMLLGALVFSDGQSTNVVDQSNADALKSTAQSGYNTIIGDTIFKDKLQVVQHSGLSIADSINTFGNIFSGVGMPSSFVLFDVQVGDNDQLTVMVDSTAHDDFNIFVVVHHITTLIWTIIGVFLLIKYIIFTIKCGAFVFSLLFNIIALGKH